MVCAVARAALLSAILTAACGGEAATEADAGPAPLAKDALMAPGQACLGCHAAGQAAANAPLSVAGTLYPAALAPAESGLAAGTVTIVDAKGQTLTLSTNAAGNFYSVAPLVFPITVRAQLDGATFTMQQSPPNGDCNACHSLQADPVAPLPSAVQGFASPPGRIYALAADAGCPATPSGCPAPVPSFARQVEPILEGNCLPCHLAAARCASAALDPNELCGLTPELDSYATLASADFSYTLACTMPAAAAYQMSPDELQIVATWLSCGAPQN